MSTGGLSKITKSCWMTGPFLASASVHLLASQKQWFILTYGIWLMSVLQSTIREEWLRLELSLLVIQSKTTFASVSISTVAMLRDMHKDRPSLRAHSSASTLEEIPILRVKPLIHTPLESCIDPLHWLSPGYPKTNHLY